MRNMAYAVIGAVVGGIAVYIGYQAYKYYVIRKTLEDIEPVDKEEKELNLKKEGKMGKTVETKEKMGLKHDELKAYINKKLEEGETLYEVSQELGLPPIVLKDYITPDKVTNGQRAKIVAIPDIPILVGGDKVTSMPPENPKIVEGGGFRSKTITKGLFY